jgi:hypothetical protein
MTDDLFANLSVQIVTPKKAFVVCAVSVQEKSDWMLDLASHVDESKKRAALVSFDVVVSLPGPATLRCVHRVLC